MTRQFQFLVYFHPFESLVVAEFVNLSAGFRRAVVQPLLPKSALQSSWVIIEQTIRVSQEHLPPFSALLGSARSRHGSLRRYHGSRGTTARHNIDWKGSLGAAYYACASSRRESVSLSVGTGTDHSFSNCCSVRL